MSTAAQKKIRYYEWKSQGLCVKCGRSTVTNVLCQKHLIASVKDTDKKRYGNVDRLELLTDQNYKCAICEKDITKSAALDHDHVTGIIRGMLCDNCNKLLGFAKDSVLILENAALYLRAER